MTDAAVARSVAAGPGWRELAPADRARLLRRFADAVDADMENLARLEVVNSGHTINNARWEAGNVRDVLTYYSGAPERLIGQQIPVPGGIDVTFHEPLGVVRDRALELPRPPPRGVSPHSPPTHGRAQAGRLTR
jgi:acyl-CoA reductase-like NAD-dependent aldehyde dehydrogenase